MTRLPREKQNMTVSKVYDHHLEAALVELGLDMRGVAVSEGWQIDATLLRNVLRKLRGICTHPQVGQLQRPGDKLTKPGALKSIGDVLEACVFFFAIHNLLGSKMLGYERPELA
jgi:hypothetical protein